MQVSGGGATVCHPTLWVPHGRELVVDVRCFRGDAPADSPFSLLVTMP